MLRIKYILKEVFIFKVLLFWSMLGFKCEEIILYDVFSLKIGSVSDLSFCDWLVLIVYWSKMCVLFFVVKNKLFLLLK